MYINRKTFSQHVGAELLKSIKCSQWRLIYSLAHLLRSNTPPLSGKKNLTS